MEEWIVLLLLQALKELMAEMRSVKWEVGGEMTPMKQEMVSVSVKYEETSEYKFQ